METHIPYIPQSCNNALRCVMSYTNPEHPGTQKTRGIWSNFNHSLSRSLSLSLLFSPNVLAGPAATTTTTTIQPSKYLYYQHHSMVPHGFSGRTSGQILPQSPVPTAPHRRGSAPVSTNSGASRERRTQRTTDPSGLNSGNRDGPRSGEAPCFSRRKRPFPRSWHLH